MYLDQLNVTLILNKSLIGATNKVSIDIESQDLQSQKEIIKWFSDGGKVLLNIYVASKTTDKSFIHFTLEKGMLSSNIGMAYLPELRKPSRKRHTNGLAGLFSELIKDVLSPKESEKLERKNKSMILYALPLFNESDFVLVNGYESRKVQIPEKFNSVEKCLVELDLNQFEQFKIA